MLLVALVVFLSLSALFSASETAFFSLSSMKVRAFSHSGDKRGEAIARLLSTPRNLLVTILMLNVLVNILVQNIVSGIFGTFSHWILTVGVPLALVLVFGEVIPKTVAMAKNSSIAYQMAPIFEWAQKILSPVRIAIIAITAPLSRLFFFYLKKEQDISLEELKHALRRSKEYGVLTDDEARLVRGYLNLEDFVMKEIMKPRVDIYSYDIALPLAELIRLFVDKECSRVPVYRGSLENLLGVLSAEDFFLNREKIRSEEELLPFIKKPHFVHELMPAKECLKEFYQLQEHLMIVVDEYGSISGIITLEDLLEVVVGQIEDKRDEPSRYTMSGKDVLISSGKLELAELEEIFDVKLNSKSNMVTVGGWLTEKLGDIPKSGTKVFTDDFLFHILAADPNRVRRVYIRRLKPSERKKHE